MTHGRPLVIHPSMSQNNISPSGIDDEFLGHDSTTPVAQPLDVPSLTECYVQSVKLLNILSEILNTFYCGSGDNENDKFGISFKFIAPSTASERLKNDDIQMLLKIDKLLSIWNRDLPDHLKACNYNFRLSENPNLFGPRTRTFNRQAITLHARFVLLSLPGP